MFEAVTVLSNRLVAEDQHELVLHAERLSDSYTRPGQYVQLGVPGGGHAYMAIANAPGGPRFEFLIQRTEGPAGVLCDAQPGDELECSPAQGKGFDLSGLEGRTPLFFAGGTGISAIRAVIESRTWDRARLFYGARTAAQMAYQDRFPDWVARGVQVAAVCSADPTWAGHVGHNHEIYAHAPEPDPERVVALLCGPRAMTDSVRALLAEAGVPPERMLTNY